MQKPSIFNKLAAVALALSTVASAAAPAGTVIENVATLDWSPENGGNTSQIVTPPVTTVVGGICTPLVKPDGTVGAPGQSATISSGESTVFSYTLQNAGNGAATFSLAPRTEAGSGFTPSDVTVYMDANANGQIDSGDTQVTKVDLAAQQTANLLVRVGTAEGSTGQAFINLVASCGDGAVDDNNVAQLNLRPPAVFTISKSFSPTNVQPGAETTVTITANNSGGDSREVFLTDFLNTQDMKDFVYVSGSARVAGGSASIEYSNDGTTWGSSESSPLGALRARAASIPSGGTLTLTFRLRAPEADLGTRRNIARLTSGNETLDAPADVTVKYHPVIALGPVGNPEANPGGEMSTDDRQTKAVALLNQEVCFSHTVMNLGERDDTITTSGTATSGAANITFRDMNGTQIDVPYKVTLAAGASQNFQACYTPTQTGTTDALKVLLTSTSSRGAANNSTVDLISTVAENKLHPVKTGDKGSSLVSPGDEITYTLSFTNAQDFALNNVVIRDPLKIVERTCLAPSSLNSGPSAQSISSGLGAVSTQSVSQGSTIKGQAATAQDVYSALQFVSADQGGVLEGTDAVWRFPVVQPGQTLNLTLKVKVPEDTADCSTITNIYNVTSDEVTTPIPSTPVTNPVFNSDNLTFSKTSTPSTVIIGEEITYIFKVTNKSTTRDLTDVRVTDTLPTGLKYVEGSSTVDGAAITPEVDPANPQKYTWKVPGILQGTTTEIRFRALVTPNAPDQLTNNAIATAVASGRVTSTPVSVASNKILPLSFGVNNADIVGYVFQDVNRNGIYDYGKDIPQEKARVILANGRIELTDKEGRYHFRNVREGTWALRLDPNSVWQQNLSMAQDAGLSGSRSVYVRNLTSIDFPLAPDAGDIAVLRDTTLTIKGGPVNAQNSLKVRKQVFQATKDTTLYTVQLTLNASAALNALTMTDPLPAGATLVSGQNTLTIDPLPGGERNLTYTFRFTGDEKAAVTDPTASWRY